MKIRITLCLIPILLLAGLLIARTSAQAQVQETLLFSDCPSGKVLPDSLRTVTQVRIYDACWGPYLDQMPHLGRVDATQIQLADTFPLVKLAAARDLILQNNDITQIDCRKLPQVEELDVAGNPLNEDDLAILLDSLPHLKVLRIGGGLITDLELPAQGRIKHLDLCCETPLTRIHGGRSNMQLEMLVLAGCGLTGDELDIRASPMDSLDLAFNSIQTLDAAGLPTDLIHLDLSYNPLEGFKGKWKKLRRLQSLDLRGCALSALPGQLAKLTSLRRIWLDGRVLRDSVHAITCAGLPPGLEALWIDLDSDAAPPAYFSGAGRAHLQEVCFSGNVPSDLSALKSLRQLREIRLERCTREAIARALATLPQDRRLMVWLPTIEPQLPQQFPHLDFRLLE